MKAMKAMKAMKKDDEGDEEEGEEEEEEKDEEVDQVDLSQGPWDETDGPKKRPGAKGKCKGRGKGKGKSKKVQTGKAVLKKPASRKTTYETAENFKKGNIYWFNPTLHDI